MKIVGKVVILQTQKGEVIKEVAAFQNIVTSRVYDFLAGFFENSQRVIENWSINNMRFGSGNREPSAGDSNMTSLLWEVRCSRHAVAIADDLSCTSITFRSVLPATPAYVGDITEVGLWGWTPNHWCLMTHALIKDAEDNPITIQKTDLMELTVLYTLEFHGQPTNPGCHTLANGCIVSEPNTAMPKFNGEYKLMPLTFGKEYMRVIDGKKTFFRGAHLQGYLSTAGAVTDWNPSNRTYSVSSRRLTAEQFNIHYINAMGVGSGISCIYSFPDVNIFEDTLLEGMPVGQGDGVTQEFRPPLNFWIADSETIYIDGTPLVRDVDYTCDWFNNLDNLPELFPSLRSICAGGAILFDTEFTMNLSYQTNRAWYNRGEYTPGASNGFWWGVDRCAGFNRHLLPSGIQTPNSAAASRAITITPDKPLILEMLFEEDSGMDWSVDKWYLCWAATGNTWAASTIRPTIKISYSSDLETWTDIEGTTTLTNGNVITVNLPEAIIAKYWKFAIVSTAAWPAYSERNCGNLFVTGRRTGRNIRFANPPASGAIITMDARIDRPLKNNKHVIDFNPVLQF